MCITILNNVFINEGDNLSVGDFDDGHEIAFIPSDISVTNISGNSIMRDIIVDNIKHLELSRTCHYTKRNKK